MGFATLTDKWYQPVGSFFVIPAQAAMFVLFGQRKQG